MCNKRILSHGEVGALLPLFLPKVGIEADIERCGWVGHTAAHCPAGSSGKPGHPSPPSKQAMGEEEEEEAGDPSYGCSTYPTIRVSAHIMFPLPGCCTIANCNKRQFPSLLLTFTSLDLRSARC